MVKHIKKIRRLLPSNFFSVFDHFVGMVRKGLNYLNILKVYNKGTRSSIGVTLMLLFLSLNQCVRLSPYNVLMRFNLSEVHLLWSYKTSVVELFCETS